MACVSSSVGACEATAVGHSATPKTCDATGDSGTQGDAVDKLGNAANHDAGAAGADLNNTGESGGIGEAANKSLAVLRALSGREPAGETERALAAAGRDLASMLEGASRGSGERLRTAGGLVAGASSW